MLLFRLLPRNLQYLIRPHRLLQAQNNPPSCSQPHLALLRTLVPPISLLNLRPNEDPMAISPVSNSPSNLALRPSPLPLPPAHHYRAQTQHLPFANAHVGNTSQKPLLPSPQHSTTLPPHPSGANHSDTHTATPLASTPSPEATRTTGMSICETG
jgi:hypothetical protein